MSEAPYVLAMDVSKARSGICEGYPGRAPTLHSISGNDVDTTVAVCRLGKWLIDRLKMAPAPDYIYLEAALRFIPGEYDPERERVVAKGNPETTIVLSKMVGVVEFIAWMKGIKLRTAHVSTVRKAFLGNGHLKGDIAKARAVALCQALEWPARNHDEADAAAVWFYAGTQVAPRLYTPITPMLQQKIATEVDAAMAAKKARRA